MQINEGGSVDAMMKVHATLGLVRVPVDQVNDEAGVWFNDALKRVSYTETGANGNVVRRLTHQDDLNAVQAALATSINNLAAILNVSQAERDVTADTIINNTDYFVRCNGQNLIITLDSIATFVPGSRLLIRNDNSTPLTLQTSNGDLIETANSFVLYSAETLELLVRSSWIVI